MILVNGEAREVIAVSDRGLAYGDGVFETMRARHGHLPLLDYHLERLRAGLRALRIPCVETKLLQDELLRAAADEPQGIVKLMVTRGSGGRGYAPPAQSASTRVVQTFRAPDSVAAWQAAGVRLQYCKTLLEGPRTLAGLKHLNRLAQVLAQFEIDSRYDEGLMRDADGRLIEGTRTNVFVCLRDQLITPPVGAGVAGVMRRFVMEIANDAGIETIERHISDAEFGSADEIFVTNAVAGICPVRQIGDRSMGIGTMTRFLQTSVENELERRAC